MDINQSQLVLRKQKNKRKNINALLYPTKL